MTCLWPLSKSEMGHEIVCYSLRSTLVSKSLVVGFKSVQSVPSWAASDRFGDQKWAPKSCVTYYDLHSSSRCHRYVTLLLCARFAVIMRSSRCDRVVTLVLLARFAFNMESSRCYRFVTLLFFARSSGLQTSKVFPHDPPLATFEVRNGSRNRVLLNTIYTRFEIVGRRIQSVPSWAASGRFGAASGRFGDQKWAPKSCVT